MGLFHFQITCLLIVIVLQEMGLSLEGDDEHVRGRSKGARSCARLVPRF